MSLEERYGRDDSGDESDIIDIEEVEEEDLEEQDELEDLVEDEEDEEDDNFQTGQETPSRPPRSNKTPMHTVTKRIVALTPGKRHYQYISPSCSDNIEPIRCASMSPDPFAEQSHEGSEIISRASLSGLNITNESPQSPSRGGKEHVETQGLADPTTVGEETYIEEEEEEVDHSGDITLVQDGHEKEMENSPRKTRTTYSNSDDPRLVQSEPCLTRKRSPSAIRILTAHTHPQNSPSERVVYSWSDTSPDDSRFQYKDSSPYSVDLKHSTPPTQAEYPEDSDKENLCAAPGGNVRLVAGLGSEICEAESPTQPRTKRRKNESLKFGDRQVVTQESEEDRLRQALVRTKHNAAQQLAEMEAENQAKISQLETDKQGLYLVIEALRNQVAVQKDIIADLRAQEF
ncbi:hypothetical protein CJU90_4635 [Yarrowia sp. C11]|nr:hypothetical protein CJU90_4635 [Yarrowia sp. C11]KAG5370576.1 hypothetical protein CKK34_0684 [Yarrowia sp. E02]